MGDDLFYEAQQAAEERLARCDAELFGELNGDSPALAPYCGCTTCQVREALDAAWPILRRAALEGYPE